MDYTEILINIRKILRSLSQESRKIQKQYGISIPQFLLLSFLVSRDDYKATHAEISKTLNLNKSTITGIIDRLEKKGYIARLPKMSDKRVTFITLTSSGFQIIENSPQLLHDRLMNKLIQLPEEEISRINTSLKQLVDIFGIDNIPASPLLSIEDPIDSVPDDHLSG
jgi:DNA-binding MarR family transcriptional regulator